MKLQTKLIPIGNSRGIRIPKELIELAGLTGELDLIARDGEILIANHHNPREGWAASMAAAAQRGELGPTPEEAAWTNIDLMPAELAADAEEWWK